MAVPLSDRRGGSGKRMLMVESGVLASR